MKTYFQLQRTMINRKLTEIGLHPIVGYLLLVVGFIGFSLFLFNKTEFAAYVYVLLALSFVSKLSDTRRNDFLKSAFSRSDYLWLRLKENLLVVSPFIIFLLYAQEYSSGIVLTIFALLTALVNIDKAITTTIPTPFSKRPFEFPIGFRNTFYLFFFAYFLTFMAVSVNNFNLGAFALMLVFFITLFFYSKPEKEYFVWIFDKTPAAFLMEKIKTALLYSTVLSLPVLSVLGCFFWTKIGILLLLMPVGYLLVILLILAKYSAFPNEMNLLQGILIGLCFAFPPLIIGVIPFFYNQSLKRLNDILL